MKIIDKIKTNEVEIDIRPSIKDVNRACAIAVYERRHFADKNILLEEREQEIETIIREIERKQI